jgi:hypothetical protein
VTLRGLIDAIRLRWYVAALVALVTLAAGWKVDHPPKYYDATAVLLLVPPKEPDAPNALAAVTPSIAQTGVLVDTVLTDATSAARLRKAGVTGDFTLAPRNNGTIQTPHYTVPAEQLTVNGADPDAAVASVTILSGLYKQELDDLQARAGVRAADRITTQVLVPPTATPVKGSKSRGLIGVAVIGAIAMVLIPVWFDRVARRRSRRKARAAARKPTATATAKTATATPSTDPAKERYAAS